VTEPNTTPQLSILQAGTGSGGYLSSADWGRFNAKLGSDTSCGGDLSGVLSAPTVARLQSRPVAATEPGNGQVLKWNGAAWAPAADLITNVTASAPLTAQGSGSSTVQLSIQAADATRDGFLASADWASFQARFDPATACGGDLSGNLPSPSVVALQSRPVSADAPDSGQVLRWDGAGWTPATLAAADVADLSSGYMALDGDQHADGLKTFGQAPVFESALATTSGGTGTAGTFGQGSVVFADGDGNYAEDNAGLNWDESSGSLHVGTTNPGNDFGATFDVVGASSLRDSGDPTKALLIDTDGSAAHRIHPEASDGAPWDLSLGTSSNPALLYLQESSGYVGIGTTEPAGVLDVAGNARAAGTVDAVGGLLVDGTTRIGADGAMANVTASTDMLVSGTLGVGRGGTGTAAFTAGGVVFAGDGGAPLQNGAQLVWDGTNARLGVGTASPATKVQIAGGDLSLDNDRYLYGPTSTYGIGKAPAGLVVFTDAATPLTLGHGNRASTPRLTIDTAGNVGIGTTVPGAALALARNGTGFGTHGTLTLANTGTNATSGSELRFQYGPTATYYQSAIRGFASDYGNTNGGSLQFLTGDSAGSSTLQPRMTIDQDGRVGIGTTSPAFSLVVASSAVNANIDVVDSGDSYNRRAQLGHSDTNGGSLILWDDGNAMKVDLRSYGASYLNGGNVGIGTTNPQQRLDVFGGTPPSLRLSTTDHFAEITEYLGYAGNNGGGLLFKARNGGTGASDTVMTLQGSTNYVGIGTTTPSAKLSVSGAVPGWFVSDFLSTNPYGLYVKSAATTSSHDVLRLDDNAGTVFGVYGGGRVYAGGNVGIGTASPGVKLELVGSARFTSEGGATNPSSGKGLEVAYVTSGRAQGEGAYLISYDRSGSAYKQLTLDAASVNLANSGGVAMRVSGGNVGIGIGTASPIRALHVNGELSISRADKVAFINVSDINGNGGGSIILRGLDSNGSVQTNASVSVVGSLSKSSGSFEIDHPLDPARRLLRHSFVESPEMRNLYFGQARTALGEAVVELPGWWTALNGADASEYNYQLTPVGEPCALFVRREVDGNRFTVGSDRASCRFHWQVSAIRHDAYAEAHRIRVEQDKDDTTTVRSGQYLHPGLFAR